MFPKELSSPRIPKPMPACGFVRRALRARVGIVVEIVTASSAAIDRYQVDYGI